MSKSGLEVVKWYEEGYGVTVKFSDGHKAHFEAYAHGFGYSIEGLRGFTLFKGDQKVFHYNSRLYRVGPQDDENKVAFCAEGYTQELAASYWRAASKYFRKEYFDKEPSPEKLWWPWRVICGEGRSDLENLEKGEAKVLAS